MNEAELLFTELFSCSRHDLHSGGKNIIPRVQASFIAAVLRERAFGVPLQYILGKAYFLDLGLCVNPHVLIPRPETELVVEQAIRIARTLPSRRLRLLDIGTGSGCIAIALAKTFPDSAVDAVDISPDALVVARKNARLNAVTVNFIQADLFPGTGTVLKSKQQCPHLGDTGLTAREPSPYDLIVSNPPYVPASEIRGLQPEVRHEPLSALDGGPEGLDFYRRIAADSPGYLKDAGYLVLEIGCGQRAAVENIFRNSGKFEILDTVKDYSRIDRVMTMRAHTNG